MLNEDNWLIFRMILKYLIPVKLSLGVIPKDELLQKYNLHEVTTILFVFKNTPQCYVKLISLNQTFLCVQYMNVVQALRKGDLRLLRHALQEHEDRYVFPLTSYCTYLHLNVRSLS